MCGYSPFMKHVILLLVFYYFSQSDSLAQAPHPSSISVIDSLVQKINSTQNDSTKILLYEKAVLETMNATPTKSLEYATKALMLAEKIKWESRVAYHNRLKGHCYYNISNYPKALDHFFNALRIDEKYDKVDAAFDMNSIAMAYRKEKEYEKAIDYYKKAWVTQEAEQREMQDFGNHIQGIGIVFQELKQYDSALYYYKKSQEAHTKYKSEDGVTIAKINIGTAYIHLLNYNLAVTYLQEGLSIMRNEKNTYGIMIVSNNLTDLYNDMAAPPKEANIKRTEKDKIRYYNEAIKYAKLCIQSSEAIEDWDFRESGYSGLSQAQAGLGMYQEALASFKKHELYKDSIYNENSKTEVANLTAQRNLDIKTREMEDREKDLKFRFAKKEDSLKYARNLADLRLNEQEQMLLMSNQSLALANNEKDLQRLAYLKTQLELTNEQSITAQKEKEIRLAKLEGEQKERNIQLALKEAQLQASAKRNTIYLSLGGLVLLAAVVGFFLNRLRIRQLKKLVEVRTTIAANLHDEVGSTLSSISMMSQVARKKGTEGNDLLEKISINSQTMLDSMSDIVWSIRPDNDKLGDIISRIRMFAAEALEEQLVKVEMDIAPDIDKLLIPMEQRKDLYLIAKEAIINIAKYSCATATHINIYTKANQLIMELHDDGKGFDENKLDSMGGNGLKNMKQRAERLNASLYIHSNAGKGTSIILSTPL